MNLSTSVHQGLPEKLKINFYQKYDYDVGCNKLDQRRSSNSSLHFPVGIHGVPPSPLCIGCCCFIRNLTFYLSLLFPLTEPFPNCIKVLLHPQLVRFHLVHCLRFHIVTTILSFGEAVNLFYSFDGRAKLISVLVEQVLQLQQIFRRRALFACSNHLKAWLGFVPS